MRWSTTNVDPNKTQLTHLTIIDVNLAQPSGHPGNTHARKVRHPIDTRRSLRARIALALVNIRIAVLPTVPGRTYALVVVLLVHALGPILARSAQTLVHIQIAVESRISGRTEAPERPRSVLANPIHADLVLDLALVNIVLAPFSLVPGWTLAHVVLPAGTLRIARPVVQTRRRSAHVVAVHVVRALALAADTPERFQTVGRRADGRRELAPLPVEALRADARRAVRGAAAAVQAVALVRVRERHRGLAAGTCEGEDVD